MQLSLGLGSHARPGLHGPSWVCRETMWRPHCVSVITSLSFFLTPLSYLYRNNNCTSTKGMWRIYQFPVSEQRQNKNTTSYH